MQCFGPPQPVLTALGSLIIFFLAPPLVTGGPNCWHGPNDFYVCAALVRSGCAACSACTHTAATRGRGRVSSDATGEQQPRGSRVPSAVRFGLAVRGGDRGAVRARRDVYPCGFDRDSSLPAPGIIYPRRSTCRSRGYHRNRMARSPLRSVPRSRR